MSARQITGPDKASDRAPETPHMNTRLEIPAATLAKLAVAVLLTLAAIWLVTSLSRVIVLVVLALVIAVVLSPLAGWLEGKGLSRGLAALLSMLAVMVVVGLVLAITIPPLINELGEFFDNLPRTGQRLRERLAGQPELYNAVTSKIDALRRNPGSVLSGAFHFGFGLATNIFIGVLILTIALYLLIDGKATRANVLRLTPAAYRARVAATMAGCAQVIKSYFIGRSIISAIFAVFTFLLLTVLHVPYATVFGALAFFFGAIPNIGSALATVLPSLIALAYRGITTALIVAGALLAYNQLENNFIQPRVLSKKMNLSAVATMIGVVAGGRLLGVIGVILAVPIVGMLPVLARIWIRRENDVDPAQLELGTPSADTDTAAAA
ncbi:MAG: AI-2E family transporter [Longimicrobiales bacterium]